MRKVIVQIQSTTETPLPSNKEFKGFRFRLQTESGANVSESTVLMDMSYLFENVVPGKYVAVVEAVDAADGVLATAKVVGEVQPDDGVEIKTFPAPGLLAFQVI